MRFSVFSMIMLPYISIDIAVFVSDPNEVTTTSYNHLVVCPKERHGHD